MFEKIWNLYQNISPFFATKGGVAIYTLFHVYRHHGCSDWKTPTSHNCKAFFCTQSIPLTSNHCSMDGVSILQWSTTPEECSSTPKRHTTPKRTSTSKRHAMPQCNATTPKHTFTSKRHVMPQCGVTPTGKQRPQGTSVAFRMDVEIWKALCCLCQIKAMRMSLSLKMERSAGRFQNHQERQW